MLLTPFLAHAQRAYEVDRTTQADVILYITDSRSQADILLFFTESQNQAYQSECDGVWYRSSYQVGSDFNYAYTTTRSQADYVVYMLNSRSTANVVRQQACDHLRRLIQDL